MNTRKLIWILWPSFIVAGMAEAVFFTLFDMVRCSFCRYFPASSISTVVFTACN